MEAHFDLIQIDVDDLFAVGAHFRDLPIEIDRISATGAARNDNTNDLCFLLHDMQSFRKWAKCGYFVTLGGEVSVGEIYEIIPEKQWDEH